MYTILQRRPGKIGEGRPSVANIPIKLRVGPLNMFANELWRKTPKVEPFFHPPRILLKMDRLHVSANDLIGDRSPFLWISYCDVRIFPIRDELKGISEQLKRRIREGTRSGSKSLPFNRMS